MKLSNQSLHNMSVRTPNYDRKAINPAIVHLGMGAFHRAHQSVYIDDILEHDPNWGIIGASLRSANTANALTPQDGLYTLIIKGEEAPQYRIIGSVLRVLVGSRDSERLLHRMALPSTRIVSLTITEKGYCHNPATGQLNPNHPDIVADLRTPQTPVSAPGFLVEALRRRKESGSGPFTILSCDNLPANGQTCRNVVLMLAKLSCPDIVQWIEKQVTFPSTMVDRIVPATTDEDRSLLLKETGLKDNWPVVTEPFSQWVIEDNFCAGRPAFEKVGVLMTSDVDPFEVMKLRLLNGSHSALAYLGLLAGHETVAQAMQDRQLSHFIKKLMQDEVAPTLDIPKNVDVEDYQTALFQRFQNTGLQHKLAQIAADGSQKLPQRILHPIQERLGNGLPIKCLAKCVAAWIGYISVQMKGEFKFVLNDPMAESLRHLIVKTGSESKDLVSAIIDVETIFGPVLTKSDIFANEVLHQFNSLDACVER